MDDYTGRLLRIIDRILAKERLSEEDTYVLLKIAAAVNLEFLKSHGVESPQERRRILREHFLKILYELEEKSGAL